MKKIFIIILFLMGVLSPGVHGEDLRLTLIKKAVARGENVNARLKDGASLLIRAIQKNRLDICKVLVQQGKCNINLPDPDGTTPLMYACGIGSQAIVNLLVQAGAKVEAQNKEGETALMFSAYTGHLGICKFLVEEKKCKVKTKTRSGNMASNFAKEQNHPLTEKFLKSME